MGTPVGGGPVAGRPATGRSASGTSAAPGSRSSRVLLWSARITGGLFVLILAFVIVANFVADGEESQTPTPNEWVSLAMFPFGVLVAYILAFRWHLAGGCIAVVCLIGWWLRVGMSAYILMVAALVAIPGALYIIYALRGRSMARSSAGTEVGEFPE